MSRTISNMQKNGLTVLAFIFLLMALISCAGEETRPKILVYVGIPPQAYFVERIVGNQPSVEIRVLLPPGKSPATFEPTPKDMSGLSQADLYFLMGVPFEISLMEKASDIIARLNVIDTRQNIPLRSIAGHVHHEEGYVHEQTDDPHTWLDPQLVKMQARNICSALQKLDPDRAEAYASNLKAFELDLDKTDSTVAAMLQPYYGKTFYVFHPSFGYFADRYGLRQEAIETEGKEPGARELAKLINEAKESGINTILVQREFSSKTAEAIAEEIDGRVIVVDPLARDYLNNLILLAGNIADAMAEGK